MAVLSRRSAMVGALWSTAALIVPLVTTLVLSIVIGRVLGPDLLGEQSLIAYVGTLVTGVLVIALTNCTQQVLAAAHGAEDAGRRASVDRLAAVAHVGAGTVAALVLFGIAAVRDQSLAWVLIGIVLFVDAIGWIHGSRLVARDGWRQVAKLRLVTQIVAALLGVASVLAGAGLAGVFGAQVITSIVLAVCLHRLERRGRTSVEEPQARPPLRPLLRLWGSFVLTAVLVNIVDRRAELVFLDLYRTADEVAVYAVAFSLVTVAVTVPTALATAMIPGIAAAGASTVAAELEGHLRRAARISVVAAFVLAAAMAAVGPTVVVVFWGEGLAGAADVLPWMTLSVLFVPLRALYDAYWVGMGNLVPVLWSGFAAAVVDLALAWWLVPDHGLTGAVVANVSAQFVVCAGIVGYTRRRLPGVRVSVPATVRALVTAVLAGSAAAGAAHLLSGVLGMVAAVLAFLVVLGLVGLAVGLLTPVDAAWLEQVLPSSLRPAMVVVRGVRRVPGDAGARDDQVAGPGR